MAPQPPVTVAAADFSPVRRRMAERLGADEVVDPAAASPHARWKDMGVPARQAVVFEAVGVPGVLGAIIREAPARARVVVVGVCMQPDRIDPFYAVAEELEVRFAFGYTREEFAATLDRLGRGGLPARELVTEVVGLDGVAGAFAALADPSRHEPDGATAVRRLPGPVPPVRSEPHPGAGARPRGAPAPGPARLRRGLDR